MQTITITEILQKLRDLIVESDDLATWCDTKYDKSPTIFVGIDSRHPPTEDSMPHILLLPGGKDEGTEESIHIYRVHVSWCVKDTGVTQTENVIEYDGVYNTDALGQLIWNILAGFSTNCPASRVEYDIEGAAFVPLFPGTMTIEIRVPVVIGATITL